MLQDGILKNKSSIDSNVSRNRTLEGIVGKKWLEGGDAVKPRSSWFNVRQVSRLLGVAATTIYSMCEQKKIEHVRIGTGGRGAIRISQDAVDAYLRRVKVGVQAGELPQGR